MIPKKAIALILAVLVGVAAWMFYVEIGDWVDLDGKSLPDIDRKERQ